MAEFPGSVNGWNQSESAQVNVLSLLVSLLTPDLFQEAIDLLEQGIVCFDPQGQLVCFNRRYTELLDLPDSLMSRQPGEREVVAFQRARGDFDSPGRFFDAEGRTLHPDPVADEMPAHYWRQTRAGKTLEVRVAWLSSGLHVRTFTDVTPYFAAQQQAQRSTARLQRVIDALNPGTWETDLVTGEVEINEAWAQLLGHDRAALVPMTRERWRAMIHPEDLEATGQARMAFMNGIDKQFDSRFRMRHRDGRWIWVRCTGKTDPGMPSDGKLLVSGTLIDISEKMLALEQSTALADRLQIEVHAQNRQLERAVMDLTMISSSLAHDLRTPLRSINGYASILSDGVSDTSLEQARAYARKIADHSATMGQMITRMLVLLQVLQVKPVLKSVRVGNVARSQMEQLTAPAAQDLVFTCADTPEVVTDPDLLGVVLEHLLRNALTYTTPAQTRRVELGHDPHLQVYWVRDNGIGFDMSMADRLFKPFSTLHRQDHSDGRGMGLAIAQRCVERLGGRLWASSVPGAGSTFYFTLGH